MNKFTYLDYLNVNVFSFCFFDSKINKMAPKINAWPKEKKTKISDIPIPTKLKRFFKHFFHSYAQKMFKKKCINQKGMCQCLKVEAQTRNIHVFINDDDEVCVHQQQTYHHRKMKEEKKNFSNNTENNGKIRRPLLSFFFFGGNHYYYDSRLFYNNTQEVLKKKKNERSYDSYRTIFRKTKFINMTAS